MIDVKGLNATRVLIAEVEKAMRDPRWKDLQPILAAFVVALTERVLIEANQEHRFRELDVRMRALEASVSPRVLS